VSVPVIDRRVVLTILVAAAWVGGGLGFVVGRAREAAALRAQLAAVRAAAPTVAPATDAERRLWIEIERSLRRRFPPESELPRTLVALAAWARSAGMDVVSVDIGAAAADGAAVPRAWLPLPPELGVNAPRLHVVAHHRARELLTFVSGLDRLPAFVALQSVDIRRTNARLASDVVLVTLAWTPEPPPAR
jgi:predicted nucleic acid-binding protein